MIKTKIEFKDIKAGDLIQTVDKVHGVKWELTGIAFELVDLGQGDLEWRTSQGGALVDNTAEEAIWRIDARVSTFDDIQEGDLIQVTSTVADTEEVVTGRASSLHASEEISWYDSWHTLEGQRLCTRLSAVEVKIEILERGE